MPRITDWCRYTQEWEGARAQWCACMSHVTRTCRTHVCVICRTHVWMRNAMYVCTYESSPMCERVMSHAHKWMKWSWCWIWGMFSVCVSHILYVYESCHTLWLRHVTRARSDEVVVLPSMKHVQFMSKSCRTCQWVMWLWGGYDK